MDGLTQEQQDELAYLNDNYGVANYSLDEAGNVVGVADDGDGFEIRPDGQWEWTL